MRITKDEIQQLREKKNWTDSEWEKLRWIDIKKEKNEYMRQIKVKGYS